MCFAFSDSFLQYSEKIKKFWKKKRINKKFHSWRVAHLEAKPREKDNLLQKGFLVSARRVFAVKNFMFLHELHGI